MSSVNLVVLVGHLGADPVAQRFMQKVEMIPMAGCWLWTGSLNGRGYGQLFSQRGAPPHKAHRLSYELFRGPIPQGALVMHSCDVRCCVNPDHLDAGTQKKNLRDAAARGRLNQRSRANLRPGARGCRGAGPGQEG